MVEPIDPATLASIATAASGNVVAHMLIGSWNMMRDAVARLFSHGAEADREQYLVRIDADRERLQASPDREAELADQWGRRLASFVEANPQALDELRNLTTFGSNVSTQTQVATNNSGSVAQIAGNVTGGVSFGRSQ